MSSPRPHRFIRRIDNEQTYTHSWHVTIRCRSHAITRHFSDSVYGGKRKALKAAIAFRDETLLQHRGPDYALWLRRKRSHNTSGIAGVARYVNHSHTSGQEAEYPYWQAFWRDLEGKRHTRTFSVLKYGERKARQLAVAARKAALEEMFGDVQVADVKASARNK